MTNTDPIPKLNTNNYLLTINLNPNTKTLNPKRKT